MLNSGGPRHEYIGFGDTLMWESYIFRHGFVGDEGDLSVLRRREDWPGAARAYEKWRDFTEPGGSIAPLCYHPVREREKDHCFLSYACSKYAGFQQWSGTARERQDILRLLHRIDTGRPVEMPIAEGPVYFRQYERALVVGNSAAQETVAEVPWHLGDPHVVDVYSGEPILARDGRMGVELPPDCGRVYVTEDAYLANCLGEVAGMAQSCSLRLAELADEGGAPGQQAQAAKRVFDAAMTEAARCRDAVKASGVPDDGAARKQIADLARALEPLAEMQATASAEERLLAGEGLTAAELPELLRTDADLPFDIEVGEGSVVLRSGGAEFSFTSGGERASLRLGSASMDLWTTKNALAEGDGWYAVRRLVDIELTADEPERKTVAFTLKLFGRDSGRDVDELDVRVRATIERGVPGIRMETALRNHTDRKLPSAYWFWNIGGRWHTFPDGTTTQEPKGREAPGETGWEYLHQDEAGGGGTVLAGHANMGYTGSQFHMFADPRNQDIEPGAEMPINFTAYVIWTPWQRDSFLQRRMRWYEQYASLAAQVVSGLRLGLDAPSQLVASVPTNITVSLSGQRARDARDLKFDLSALADGRELAVRALGEDRFTRMAYTLEVPADLAAGRRVELRATASVGGVEAPVKLTSFETLRVRLPVEVLDLRQAPVAEGGLGFAVTLRNNLPEPLQVDLTMSGKGLRAASQGALPADGESTVVLAAEGADIPATADKLTVKLSISYQLQGAAHSAEHQSEIALLPQAVCQTAANPPTLDGKLDDSCWTFATKLANFVHHQTAKPAKEQTVCYVLADDANLYLGFECAEEDMQHLRAKAAPDEQGLNPDVPRDDSVEIYVDPRTSGKKYFRLAVNSLGAAKSSASGGWEVGVATEADRWIVEVRLPFEIIGARPKPGDVWGFNACRNDQGSGEATAWSCTQGSYAKPERFGGLLFSK